MQNAQRIRGTGRFWEDAVLAAWAPGRETRDRGKERATAPHTAPICLKAKALAEWGEVTQGST